MYNSFGSCCIPENNESMQWTNIIPLVKLLIVYMKSTCLYALCFLILSVVAISNYSCNKSGDDKGSTDPGNEKPGQIPGMGNAGGVPQGEPFKLPAAISLTGDIVGNEDGLSG